MKRISIKDPVLFGHLLLQSGILTVAICLSYVKNDCIYLFGALGPFVSIVTHRLFFGNGLDN